MEYNQIICGDCLEVMKGIPDKSVDLVLTSPPYLDREVKGDYYGFLDVFIKECNRISDTLLMFNSSRRIVEICKRYNNISAILIWDKVFTLPAFKYEPIFVITKNKIWGKGRIYRDCLRYMIPRNKKHINENPVELYKELLKFFPNAKIVLDPFLGSGTTAVACKELGRRYIGIEISPEYCEIARNRVKAIPELLF